jgi:hypothetical protein
MGCNCGKKKPEPTPEPIPQTPEELHTKEITEWNGGVQITDDKKQDNELQ